MKAAVLTEYRQIEWRDVPTPTIGPTQALVQVAYASICGSDQHIFNGDFHPRTSLPLVMGHEFAGTLVEVGPAVSDFQVGDRVAIDPIYWCGSCPACERQHYPACSSLKLVGVDSDGGFAQFAAVEQFMLHKVPAHVSDRQAALVELLSIGFHACRRAGLQRGDRLAIVGVGRVGQSILQAARTITDEPIYLVDVLGTRLRIAQAAWPNVVAINTVEQDPAAVVREHTKGRGVDVAIEAVGHARAVEGRLHPVALCVELIRGAGTVCVLGLGDEPAPVPMKKFIWKEARLIASRVTHGEFRQAIDALAAGRLKPEALISREMPASEAQQAFELLERRPEDYLKIVLSISTPNSPNP